jgi:hypothetical protein
MLDSDPAHTADDIKAAAALGLIAPEICLPRPGVDLAFWPVIACDQFTSEPEYWQETAALVGDRPSTLHLILPELYLDHPGRLPVSERITRINQCMRQYLTDGTLQTLPAGWILVDRATPVHPSRKGLLVAIDLDCYDFRPGSRQLIRATEGTVLERIPPRLRIRQDAPLELPHVQLLIDDPARSVIEPLFAALQDREPLYATSLMQGGGSVRSWFMPAGGAHFQQALQALSRLDSVVRLGLLAAVGDGNHSLATAKAHWESLRHQVAPDHPARFALVELINIFDVGLAFEPIHRVIFGLSPEDFLAGARAWFAAQDLRIDEAGQDVPAAAATGSDQTDTAEQAFSLLWRDRRWQVRIGCPAHSLIAGSLQPWLDSLVSERSIRIDYVHGDDVVRRLAADSALGLLLPALTKADFFQTIAREGILPRKTFSMGEAREKRYYFESRRIN